MWLFDLVVIVGEPRFIVCSLDLVRALDVNGELDADENVADDFIPELLR